MKRPSRQIASERREDGVVFAKLPPDDFCAAVFCGVINYVDRQIIGILKLVLLAELWWNKIITATSFFCFRSPMPSVLSATGG
jgi:hypothetical protein